MFIREIINKNPGYDREFVYHRLMESVRTPRGPRQRMVLNLGKLDIPKDEWKILANRIEEIISGQETLVKPPRHIEDLARHYSRLLIQKRVRSTPPAPDKEEIEEDWETVNLGSLSNSESRTIGGEALGYYAFRKLEFPRILRSLGFGRKQVDRAALLVIGRLLHPASERETALWGSEMSALGELMGADFHRLSNNALYRTSDLLLEKRDDLEKCLRDRERSLLGLSEKIILYDLTNTYFEGKASGSERAKRGHSKEKRTDCPLLTLALVLDEDGFLKGSKVFPGNVSEPGTLKEILEGLRLSAGLMNNQLSLLEDKPTVVIDAGIATKENVKLIKAENYHYLCVSRTRPLEIPDEGLLEYKNRSGGAVSLKKTNRNGEVFLYCRSEGRHKKEEGMKTRFTKRFEEGLAGIESSLKKPRGHKKLEDIMERLGRLREKCPMVARFYNVEVKSEAGRAVSLEWKLEKKDELDARFAGSYYIRTDRDDLPEEEMWSLYTMLTQVEDAFRCLKSELGLRPNFHQKDDRMEGHIFISVLAYHFLSLLRRELKAKGIHHRWQTIRERMATQTRVTTSITNREGKRIHFRQTTDPEPFHREIYRALNLPPKPLRCRRVVL